MLKWTPPASPNGLVGHTELAISVNGITRGVHVMHATTVAIDLAKEVFELA